MRSKRKGIAGIRLAALVVCALLVSAGAAVAFASGGVRVLLSDELPYEDGTVKLLCEDGTVVGVYRVCDCPLEPGSVVAICGELGIHEWVVYDGMKHRGLDIQSLAEFEALFPPNPDGESIVHDIPHLPVVIDGVRYEAEDIHLFNGQVLRFVLDDEAAREGVIYAFTTPQGLERFVEERWGIELFGDRPESALRDAAIRTGPPPATMLREHRNLGGRGFLITGRHGGVPNLGIYDFDNITSSVATGPGAVVLYDEFHFIGNSYWLNTQRTYSFLWFFNDRASSLWVH